MATGEGLGEALSLDIESQFEMGWACIGLAEAWMGCQWQADADASGILG